MIAPYQFEHEPDVELPEPVGFRGVWWGIAFMVAGVVLFALAIGAGLLLNMLITLLQEAL